MVFVVSSKEVSSFVVVVVVVVVVMVLLSLSSSILLLFFFSSNSRFENVSPLLVTTSLSSGKIVCSLTSTVSVIVVSLCSSS